jgi:hypothetical protein
MGEAIRQARNVQVDMEDVRRLQEVRNRSFQSHRGTPSYHPAINPAINPSETGHIWEIRWYIYNITYFYIGEPNDDKLFLANIGKLNDDKLFFGRSMLPYWVSSLPKFWRQQVPLEQPERWKSLRLKLFVVLRCLWQQWDSWQHHGPLPLCGNEIESRVDIRIQNCKAWLLCWKIWFVWE